MMESCLSVVMPVFNEIQTLDAILERTLSQYTVKEIVIVDDGSTDGSGDRLAEWQAREPKVQVHSHPDNRGKGSAIMTALAHVTGTYVVIQDADLEYSPEDYPRLLEPIVRGKTEVVYGSRFHRESNSSVPLFMHLWGNRFLTWCTNRVTGLRLTDMATCYKVMSADWLRSLDLREPGFGVDPEITVKLARRGSQILEVPISYTGRARNEGKKIRWRDGLTYLRCLIHYGWLERCAPKARRRAREKARLKPEGR